MTTATIEQLRARLSRVKKPDVVTCGGLAFELRKLDAGGLCAIQEPYTTLAHMGKKATAEDRANALRNSNLALVRGRVINPDLSGFSDEDLLGMDPTMWKELVAECSDQDDELDPEAALKNSNETEGDEPPSV